MIVDTGELLFPAIVLGFCSAYFVETRGLPSESMLFAGPLLYATAFLAIITIFGHAVSIRTDGRTVANQTSPTSDGSIVWGVEDQVAKQKHPKKDTPVETGDEIPNTTNQFDSAIDDYFNIYSASILFVLSTGYVMSLYFLPFIIVTVPFLATSVYLFGERNIRIIVLYSIGFSLLLWIVFINWLQVPFP